MVFSFLTEDMKIRKEVIVTYEELAALDEQLVIHLQPGQHVKTSLILALSDIVQSALFFCLIVAMV